MMHHEQLFSGNDGGWASSSLKVPQIGSIFYNNEQKGLQMASMTTEDDEGITDAQLSMLDEFHFQGLYFEDDENMLLPSTSTTRRTESDSDDAASDSSSAWTPVASMRGTPSPSPSSSASSDDSFDSAKIPGICGAVPSVSPYSMDSYTETETRYVVNLAKYSQPLPSPPPHPLIKQMTTAVSTSSSASAMMRGTKTTTTASKRSSIVSRVSSGSLTSAGSHDLCPSHSGCHSNQRFSFGRTKEVVVSPTESSLRRNLVNPKGLLPLAPMVLSSSSLSSSPVTMEIISESNVSSSNATAKSEASPMLPFNSSSFDMEWEERLSSVCNALNTETTYMDRKRKHSVTQSSSNLSTTSNVDDFGNILTEEEMEIRRERNRVHAKKSRQRKKCLTTELHQSLEVLREENEKLRRFIYSRIGENQTEEILSKRRLESHRNFIDALKNDDNRLLDSKTATFLRGLRKNVLNLNKKASPASKMTSSC